MKKYLWVVAITIVLALATAPIAMANGGPHGGYTQTTDACAGCHRAHTANGGNLLIATSTYNLCTTCHGSTAGGAQTNVVDGVYAQYDDGGTYTNKSSTGSEGAAGASLNAGGFTNAYNPISGTFEAFTSAHTMDEVAAWGNGGVRGATSNIAGGLSCGSCHDPHGTDGYRLLRWGPIEATDDYDDGSKDYTVIAWDNTDMSLFCANCHGAYHETVANVGNDTSVQAVLGTYTHRVDMAWNLDTSTNVTSASFGANNPEALGYDGIATSGDEIPLAGTDAVCTTCHFPHGSSAVSDGDGTGQDYGSDGPSADTALLRLDGRGVCQSCHAK